MKAKRYKGTPTGVDTLDYAYDSEYHQLRRHTHAYTLAAWASVLSQFGRPASVLDVGCAEGVGVEWLQAQGIQAIGLDLAVRPGMPYLLRQDLRQPCDLGRTFDLVTSWEVAEHLPSSAAQTLVNTIARHVAPHGHVIFTASAHGGTWHPNPKPIRYWLKLFAEYGLVAKPELSKELAVRWKTAAPRASWYWEQPQVLRFCHATA